MVACNTSVSNQCYVGQLGFRNVYFSVVSVGYYFLTKTEHSFTAKVATIII